MKTLKINIRSLSLLVPDDFQKWTNLKQINYLKDRIENMELDIVDYKLKGKDEI